MSPSSPTQGLSVLLPDKRGWQVIEVEALSATRIFKIELPLGNNNFKKLQLVSQKTSLRVYVNPDLDQPDEWEIPAGSGTIMLIGSPVG